MSGGGDVWRRCEPVVRAPGGPEPSVEIDPEPPARDAALERAADERWAELTSANPRLFNGPVLSFVGFDASTGRIRARRDRFKYLAAQPGLACGVVQLGVTGLLVARDGFGRAHALVGERGAQTRIFGGMWELAPSGGVDPPPLSQGTLDVGDLWRAMLAEIREELALPVEPDPGPVVAYCLDPVGMSFEVVFRVDLVKPVEELMGGVSRESEPEAGPGGEPGGEGGPHAWEYARLRWLGLDELPAFDAARGGLVIPPTRALLRALSLV